MVGAEEKNQQTKELWRKNCRERERERETSYRIWFWLLLQFLSTFVFEKPGPNSK
jgi:hypothetical protein